MIRLDQLKEKDTICRIYEDSDIIKYDCIRDINNYGSKNYVAFIYGGKNDWDIDYGYPNGYFYKKDEKDLFYDKEEALKELEKRKQDLSNKLQDKNNLITFLYNKALPNLSKTEKDFCIKSIEMISDN